MAFIDTNTGTWGSAEDLVFVEVDPQQEQELLAMSDSEIVAWGNANGDAPLLGGGI